MNKIPNSPRFDAKDDALVSILHKSWDVESLGIALPMKEDLDSSLFPPRISFHDNMQILYQFTMEIS